MNPFKLLAKISKVTSQLAKVTRKDGSIVFLRVRPETRVSENLVSDFTAVTTIRAWSYDVSDPVDGELGQPIRFIPDEGDILEVTSEDNVARYYRITRDSTSSKYWVWKYNRPGNRITFYTRYETL